MSQIVRGADNVGTGKSTGAFSHAEGINSIASGGYAHAEGSNTAASGNYSHAEGYYSTANTSQAHSEGNSTTASGSSAHAEGTSTIASGSNAHAEGATTVASAAQAHAEGDTTTASGTTSHAEGGFTAASGSYSHTEGISAAASRYGQHAKASGFFAAVGDAQYSNYVLMASTATATSALLTSGGSTTVTSSGATTNVVTIPASRATTFRAEVIARRTDTTGETAAFHITGVCVRDVSGAPRLVGTPVTVSWADSGASTWTVVPSIVTLAGPVYYLALTVTGEAAKSIRWCATLHTTEVG